MNAEHTSDWIPGLRAKSAGDFVRKSFFYHAVRAVPRRRHLRTVAGVRAAYDESRSRILESIETLDWDAYTRFPADKCDFVLLDDRLEWAPLRAVRDRMISVLQARASRHISAGATVVEFGSGDGRNILRLSREFPSARFVGLELSDVSVELSTRAARRFGISNATFHVADVCRTLPDDAIRDMASPVAFVFSCFALEMMPRIFTSALHNMFQMSADGVLFLEPVCELWPMNIRGIASRLRVRQLDRLQNFTGRLRDVLDVDQWCLESSRRVGLALNPLNEMTEIYLTRRR